MRSLLETLASLNRGDSLPCKVPESHSNPLSAATSGKEIRVMSTRSRQSAGTQLFPMALQMPEAFLALKSFPCVGQQKFLTTCTVQLS